MLQLNGITVRLGGHTILDGASAALPPGSRVGLVGRNGAGKSTLMKAAMGFIEPDAGTIEMPKGTRIGYLEQEAPGGKGSALDAVMAADHERARLIELAETTTDPHTLAEAHERLNAIEGHSAPARAARILAGLGFDDRMQKRPLDSFSGGWRMRVGLAGLLFSDPDLLLLDEPSNHLDLEATLWLEDFLRSCRATMLIVSHERDLLNHVADHILHLERGQLTLYQGDYDSFERQRRERQAQAAAAREKQLTERAKLQGFVDRWRAKAHSARQAQSRMKALARMEPVAALVDDPSLAFDFPDPDELKPPMVALENVAVGYAPGSPVLRRLDLRIDPDDRIALLGRNGNGKTTLARLLAGQLKPQEGTFAATGKLRVGYFTQYQVEELDTEASPLDHMTRLMPGAAPKVVRAQLGRFGFSGPKATMAVGLMSGGERARLALALVTRDAPHILILDEPTNHLDVDSREALVQALSAYSGAVVIVSHDRHMLELTADRLILLEDGTAHSFDGTLGDYTDHVLGRARGAKVRETPPANDRKTKRREAAELRSRQSDLRQRARRAELSIAELTQKRDAFDKAMFDPASAPSQYAERTMTELMQMRAQVVARLEEAEAEWLAVSEELERENAA